MKFGTKKKMRSMMFSNYLSDNYQAFKIILDAHFINLETLIVEYSPNFYFWHLKFGMIG